MVALFKNPIVTASAVYLPAAIALTRPVASVSVIVSSLSDSNPLVLGRLMMFIWDEGGNLFLGMSHCLGIESSSNFWPLAALTVQCSPVEPMTDNVLMSGLHL